MTYRYRRAVLPGETLEMWVRAKNLQTNTPLALFAGHELVFKIARLDSYSRFFRFKNHQSVPLDIEVDLEEIEFNLIYCWHDSTVLDQGVAYWEFGATSISRYQDDTLHLGMKPDEFRPGFHFTPFRHWMNDPNGLCYVDGLYHLFYQYHPNSSQWGPMHWGHAISSDLVNWTHLPVFLHPEQNLEALGATGGAFSGSALIESDGEISFFMTERLPAYDLYQGYSEIQKRVKANRGLLAPVHSEVIIETAPAGVGCDFRDPKVWFNESLGRYQMVLGAAIESDPCVLLYESDDQRHWRFVNRLYTAPEEFRNNCARCVECPDFFELDGKWVLVMGYVGYTEPESGRHNLLYAVIGDFDGREFKPTATPQVLDFGTDFYAMQSFSANNDRLAIAWLFNWEFSKPEGSDYSGEMSLPRKLSLNEQGRLCMVPFTKGGLHLNQLSNRSTDKRVAVNGRSFHYELTGELNGITITLHGADSTIHLAHDGARLVIACPEDDGKIVFASEAVDLKHLLVVFDSGIIEVFANNGAVCGTRRSYRIATLTSVNLDVGRDGRIDTLLLGSLET